MLKQDTGDGQLLRKIQGGGEKVANRYLDFPTGEMLGDSLPDFRMRILRHGVRGGSRQAIEIVQHALESVGIHGADAEDFGSGELLRKGGFIDGIVLAWIVGEERNLMLVREASQDIVGADFAAGIDREELACLNPQQSH
jgi:hypothetical protein